MSKVHLLVPSLTRVDVARGGLNYYRGTAVALTGLGTVIGHELAGGRADLPAPEGVSVRPAADLDEMAGHLRRDVGAGDVVVKFVGALGLDDWRMDRLAGEISRRAGARAVYVDPDAPSRMALLGGGAHLNRALRDYDGVVLLAGGARAVEEYRQLTTATCWHASPALIATGLGRPSPVEPVARYDVMLCAAGRGGREVRAGELIHRWLRDRPDLRILLVGHWPEGIGAGVGRPGSLTRRGYLPVPELLEAYRSSRFVVNLLRADFGGYGETAAARVFEATWSGSCLVTEPFDGLDRYLAPGRECLVTGWETGQGREGRPFDVPEQTRRDIAAAGRRRVLRDGAEAADALRAFVAGPPTPAGPPHSPQPERPTWPATGTNGPQDGDVDFWRRPAPARVAVLPEVSAAFRTRMAGLCPGSELVAVDGPAGIADHGFATAVVTVGAKEELDDALRFRPHRVTAVIVEPSDTDPARTLRWISGRDWLTPADAAAASPWLV